VAKENNKDKYIIRRFIMCENPNCKCKNCTCTDCGC